MRTSSSSQYSERQLKQAIEWFVCLQSEECPAEALRRFEAWLAKNDNHRAAYAEAEKIWTNMDDLKFMPIPGLDQARTAKPRKSMAAQLASLAFFILSSTLIDAAWLEYNAETIDYATRMGEHRRIELVDNSTIDLNTDSRISVRISLLQRNVVLTQGESLFEVNHNRLRPFTVKVADLRIRIRDVGTRFNVHKHANGAIISVLEGEVELNKGRGVISEHIDAGNQRNYSETAGLGRLETVEAENLTAWVNGQLVFKHTPLHEVMAELERYHPFQFTFAEACLAAAISGVQAVALPVILSVLVALVAFLPGLFMPGWAGQMMRPICLVMILTLVFSLIEALLILPSHLAAPSRPKLSASGLERLRAILNRGLERFVERYYRPFLQRALDWRYLTIAGFMVLILLCAAWVNSGRIRLSVQADVVKDSFWVSLKTPQDMPYSEARHRAAAGGAGVFFTP